MRRFRSSVSTKSMPKPGALVRLNRPSRGRAVKYRVHTCAGVVPFAGFGGMQLGRTDMHIRQMPDHRLRLMGYKLDAMRLCQRRAAQQSGNTAHFYDIGLDHADTRLNQLYQAARRIGLLARRHGYRQLGGNFAHGLDMIVLNRFFGPPIAKIFQRPDKPDGAPGRIAVVGVEGEGEVIADKSADGARLFKMVGDIGIRIDAGVGKTNFYRCRLALHPLFDDAQDIVQLALHAIAAD